MNNNLPATFNNSLSNICVMFLRRFTSRPAYVTLIVLTAIMFGYYFKSHVTSLDFIFNADYSIDKELEQIPICNSDDRSHQRSLLTMLYAWSQFAHEHKFQYWIAYGTLVGYVQRGGLLPHDQDIDILTLADDTQYLLPFSDTDFSFIYELQVHPQWAYVGYTNRSYWPSQGIDFVAPNARFQYRKLHYHIDIWPIYDYRPDQPRNTTNAVKTLTEYSRSYRWLSTPVIWTFPLKSCIFSGIKVWCPAMPDSLVVMSYGLGAVNKTNKRCVNRAWVSV